MEGTSALPSTRYAKSGNVHVAYQAFGEGEIVIGELPVFLLQLAFDFVPVALEVHGSHALASRGACDVDV